MPLAQQIFPYAHLAQNMSKDGAYGYQALNLTIKSRSTADQLTEGSTELLRSLDYSESLIYSFQIEILGGQLHPSPLHPNALNVSGRVGHLVFLAHRPLDQEEAHADHTSAKSELLILLLGGIFVLPPWEGNKYL